MKRHQHAVNSRNAGQLTSQCQGILLATLRRNAVAESILETASTSKGTVAPVATAASAAVLGGPDSLNWGSSDLRTCSSALAFSSGPAPPGAPPDRTLGDSGLPGYKA